MINKKTRTGNASPRPVRVILLFHGFFRKTVPNVPEKR